MLAKDASRAVREAADVNQTQFAKRLGISREHVTQVEIGGRRYGPEVILKIAKKFRKAMFSAEVTPSDFMRI